MERDHIEALTITVHRHVISIGVKRSGDDDVRSVYLDRPISSYGPVELTIPSMDELRQLRSLHIDGTVVTDANGTVGTNVILNTDMFCALDSLRELSLYNLTISINDPQCIALPNLRSVNIGYCTFNINVEGYENVLEMFRDYSPKLRRIAIRYTNMTGTLPDMHPGIRIIVSDNDGIADYYYNTENMTSRRSMENRSRVSRVSRMHGFYTSR